MCCSPRADWPTASANWADLTSMLSVLKDDGDDRNQNTSGSVPPNGCIFRVNGIVQDGDRMFGTTVWCEEESSIGVSAMASTFERAKVTIRRPLGGRELTAFGRRCIRVM